MLAILNNATMNMGELGNKSITTMQCHSVCLLPQCEWLLGH